MFALNLLKVTNHGNGIENLKDSGINVTSSGLIIVFAMLVLLVIILTVFGFVMSRLTGAPKKEKPKKEPKVEKKADMPVAPVVSASSEDDDVIAAISAAVMMMYEGTGKTPVIRSIRPSQKGVRSAWGMAGVMNNTRPF